jgi:microtubule-associated protein, RP/EB family
LDHVILQLNSINLYVVERGSVRKASPATPQTQRTGPVSVASKPAPRAGALVGGVNPAEFQKQITQLQVTIDGIEKERDFYFAKLRDVEILVQNCLGMYF